MELRTKVAIFPVFLVGFLLSMGDGYLKNVRVEEIPFAGQQVARSSSRASGIHLISSIEHQRTFLHLFHVPCE